MERMIDGIRKIKNDYIRGKRYDLKILRVAEQKWA